jgi:hypothetical protein
MKIYPKNRIYITFPDPPDEQTEGWLIGGTLYTREELRQINQESRGYERTINRLQASKLRKRIKQLTDAS